MSAPIRKTIWMSIRYLNVCKKCFSAISRIYLPGSVAVATLARCNIQTIIPLPNTDENSKEESTGENLSTKTLIRNGSVWTVDAATSLLTQTTTSLLQMENEYVQAVHKLTDMLSYKLQVLDNDAELEIVWDLVLQFRSDVNEIKRKKEEMEQLYSSVQKLMDISAEVAFIAGAEYASTCAGERLYSSQRQLELTRALTAEAEIQLNQVELKDIEATTKHHEKKEKEKSEQDKTDK